MHRILAERKNSIKSLIALLKDSVTRVTNIIKGAINGSVATILEFPEKIKKAIKTVEKNSRSEAYISNLGIYAKISKVEVFKEKSILIIRDRITIPLTDRIKTKRRPLTFWVLSAD